MSSEQTVAQISTPVAVFDLDGTLYDKRGLALRMVLRQLCHLRLLKAERDVRRAMAGTDFGAADAFLGVFYNRIGEKTGVSPEKVESWYNDNYMPAMVDVLRCRFSLRPWVEPALRELRARGVRVAVFSDYPCAPQKLQALGFRPEWADAGVFDAPSMGGLKPCRASFLRLAAAIGAAPDDITVIGDRADTDVEGARRSGMSHILI